MLCNIHFSGRPGPPEGPIKFESISADQMTLSWLPPKDDGGSKITNYVIEKREANRRSWVHVTNEPKECIFTVPKLLEGHEYIFRIMAQNKYGIGEPLDSEPETARNLFSTCIIVSNVSCSWGMSTGTAGARAGICIASGGAGVRAHCTQSPPCSPVSALPPSCIQLHTLPHAIRERAAGSADGCEDGQREGW